MAPKPKSKLEELGYTDPNPTKKLSALDPLGYDGATPSYTPIEGPTPSKQYTPGYIYGSSLKDHIADNQDHWDELANAVVQTASEAVLGTLEATSYLADFDQHKNQLNQESDNYSNWFADMMKQAKEKIKETNPIYLSEENETFNPSSAEWWASNSPSVVGTALSLIIPAAGAAKIGKMAGLDAMGQQISAVVASRLSESTMEANQVYEKSYNQLVAQGIPEKAAALRAGKAASKVWNTNWLFALQDYHQFNAMFKGFNSAIKGAKGNTIAELGKTMLSESAEEAGQYVTAEEGTKSAIDPSTDFFGEGFATRLSDYVQDDEFKTSALLGAIGGAAFQGASSLGEAIINSDKLDAAQEWFKDNMTKLTKRGIAKEQANYTGDTGTSQKITDQQFAEQLFSNLNAGKAQEFKSALESQVAATTGNLDPEVRKQAEEYAKDVDFIVEQQAKLKSSKTPAEFHNQILASNLELRQLSRLDKRLESELLNHDQELLKQGELDQYTQPLKTLQLSAYAYDKLAQSNPQYRAKADQAQKNFQAAINAPEIQLAFPNIDKALTTTIDDTLKEKSFQLVSTKEKAKVVKDDIYDLTTPQGRAKKSQEAATRKTQQEVEALLKSPTTTKQQLQEAKLKAPTPELVAAIDAKINNITQQEKDVKKDKTATSVQQELDPFAEADTALAKAEEEAGYSFDSERAYNFDERPDFSDFPEPTPDEELNVQVGNWFAPEDIESTVTRLTVETPKEVTPIPSAQPVDAIAEEKFKDPGTVITRSKQIAGTWKDAVFTESKNPDGTPKLQEYFDNTTGKAVPFTEVFASDTNGIPLINTPIIQEGQPVVLKLVDDGKELRTRYSLTPGFKPDREANYVIQVFQVDKNGKAYGKPIDELPSADSPGGSNPASLTDLRSKVINSPTKSLSTTISSKNIGDVRTSSNDHSLDIFSTDYKQAEDYSWSYGKTSHNPIIAVAKLNGTLDIPNLYSMQNIDQITIDRAEATKQVTRGNELSPGMRYVLRTNSRGNFGLVALQGRTLSTDESAWVTKNLVPLITSGDIESLNEVLFVRKAGIGLFSTNGGKKARDIVKDKGRQIIIVEQVQGKPKVLIPLTSNSSGHNEFVSFTLNQLQDYINGDVFTYQKIDKNGHWPSNVYSSSKADATEVTLVRGALDKLLKNSFRNMRDENINSEVPYNDPATGEHASYFDFLTKTNTATAKVPGSNTIGYGEDNSYSFYNVGLRINVDINPVKVVQKTESNEIIITDAQDVPPPSTSEEADFFDSYTGKARPATAEGYRIMTEKELSWFTTKFGNEALDVVKDVDRIMANGGLEAYGIYNNALVTLANYAEEGTLYHEAFHFIIDPQLGLITAGRRNKILEEGKKIYKTKNESEVEENLAEDFRNYILSDGKKVPKANSTKSLFRRLWEAIKNLLGLRAPIENMFADLADFSASVEQLAFFRSAREKGFNGEQKTRLLPGFRRYNQQVESVTVSAYQIMNYIWEAAKSTGMSVNELLTDKGTKDEASVLDVCFETLRNKFKKDQDRIASIPKADRTPVDNARFDSYSAMGVSEGDIGSWNDKPGPLDVETGFKTEVMKQFAQYGFPIQLKDGTVYTQVGNETSEPALTEGETQDTLTELFEEDPKDQVHGIDITMKDPAKGLTQNLKLFLASIPDQDKKSYFGLPLPMDFNAVFSNLSAKLANKQVPTTELAAIAEDDNTLRAIFEKLSKEVKEGNTKILAEFNTRFNLASTTFVTFIDEYKNGVHSARMIETNRNSAHKAILAKWREGFSSNQVALTKRDGEVNLGTTNLLYNKVQQVKTKYIQSKKDKKTLPYSKLKGEFNAILKDLNVTLPAELWKEVESGTPESQRKTVETWFFGEQSDSLENFFFNLKNGGVIEATSVFDRLAARSRMYSDLSAGDSFLDEKNNQRYPINLPSALTDLLNEIKADGRRKAAFYEQDKFYSPTPAQTNEFVKLMKDPSAVEQLEVLNPSAYRAGESIKGFDERTPADSIITRLIGFQNNGSNLGAFFLGTHEAKQKQSLLTLKKHKSLNDAEAFFKRVLRNTVDSEIIRIQRLKSASTFDRARYESLKATKASLTADELIEYNKMKFMENNPLANEIQVYNSKGNQFLYIPGINKIPNVTASLFEGEISDEEMKSINNQINLTINDFIEDQYQGFIEELVSQGVISIERKNEKDNIVNELIPDGIMEGKEPNTFLRLFFYNDMGWRFELSKVFNGDIAFYKSDDDYFKRGYQTVTPGTKPFNDPGNPTTFNTAIYPKLPKVNTYDYLASLAQIVDKNVTASDFAAHIDGSKPSNKPIVQKLADYSLIANAADSQTLMTVDAWKKIAEPLGDWTKEHELLYQFAWKNDQTVSQAIVEHNVSQEQAKLWRDIALKVATAPMKPFQFSERMITLPDGGSMIVKEQFKDSRASLNPEFALRNNEYKKLLAYMRANKVDVLINADAVKVGNYGVIDLNQPIQPWQIRNQSLTDLRLPQLNNNRVKTEASGSQFHKLILGNIQAKDKYTIPNVGTKDGQYVIEEYNQNWADIHERDSKDLKERMGFTVDYRLSTNKSERSKQLFKIKVTLEQELMSRGLNENYSDALRLVLDEMNQPRFLTSIAFPNYASKFVGTLTNIFKKTFLNPKSPGFVGVDMADFVTGQDADSNLKFVTNTEGKVTEAEIGMPVSFFNKIGLNYRDYIDRKTNKLNWDKLNENQKQALQGILYRIPTSNKSSMLPVRIVMVIAPAQGQVVMVPPELLTQQGLDFDYDKSQIIMRVLDGKGKVEQTPETKIFDLAWSILTSPNHFEELMTALTSKNIKTISDTFKSREEQRWLSPMNPARDVIAEDQNKDAKRMIGIFSRGNTAHAVLQTIKDYVSTSASINIIPEKKGYKFNELGRVENNQGKYISESFGEYQQAALDSGKDPLLYFLSTNKTTAPLIDTMLLYGMSPDLIISFLKQPVITEWLRNFQVEGNANKALAATLDGTKGLKQAYSVVSDPSTVSNLFESNLVANLDTSIEDDLAHSSQVLLELMNIIDLSKTVTKMTNVLSVDTFGDMTGPESIEAMINQAIDLTEVDSPIRFDVRVFDYATAPKESKRLASFFKHALGDALEFVGQFYPYMNQSYVAVKDQLANTLDIPSIYNKTTIKKLNQFLDFHLMETNGFIAPVLNELSPNRDQRWYYSKPDKSIFMNVEAMVKAYPFLAANKFINSIRSSYSNKSGVQMIGVNNSNSRTNKTELTKAWRDLMLNANPMIRTLGYDLVRFGIYTSGFGFNTRSFADLIPNDFWVESGIADNHYKALEGLLPDNEGYTSTRLDNEGASRSFIRHMFRDLDEVPSLYVKWNRENGLQSQLENPKYTAESQHIHEFTISMDSPLRKRTKIGNFVKIKTSRIFNNRRVDDYRLYEVHPYNKQVFREVQPLGEPGAFFEVTSDGRNQSALPINKDHGSSAPWDGDIITSAAGGGTKPEGLDKNVKKEQEQQGTDEVPDCVK